MSPGGKWRFAKMHGAGNDFVVLDCIRQEVNMTPSLARSIADRHLGIGCDQVLLVESPPSADVDFSYRIFNADGGEVEQCGNGARCFVRFVHEQGLSAKTALRVITKSGVIVPRLEPDGRVTVDMGAPVLDPARVLFDVSGLAPSDVRSELLRGWPLEVDGQVATIYAISMGNPHAVQFVDDVDRAPVLSHGASIERNARFAQRVNVGFAAVRDRQRLRLRVFERGAGETLACGTGACAAVVAGILLDRLTSPVVVETRGGELTIAWSGADNAVFMTGPAQTVFEGELDPRSLLGGSPHFPVRPSA
jgi:diaminopimelate epimerase